VLILHFFGRFTNTFPLHHYVKGITLLIPKPLMKPIFTLVLLIIAFPAFCQYNFYFGNIHSHSAYSDGNKDSTSTGHYTPGDDYNYAKGSYHMDFLGVSDHNHYTATNNPGMHVADYGRGLYQADTANRNGSFVAMYGFEWGTISRGGHVIAYGVPGLIGWESGSGSWGSGNNYNIYCAKGDFSSFWSIIQSYPNAFCTLAHPQNNDYGNLLADETPYNAITDKVTVGISVRSGSAFSMTNDYSDPPASSFESKYITALSKGYRVGPTIDHDNHYTTFGRTNPSRTVVLASSLHRDSIMAAYRANRFYASDDWNAEVNFTVNGNYMGSNVTTNQNSFISISVNDPDAASNPDDNSARIELFYGIPQHTDEAGVLNVVNNGNSLSFTHNTTINSNYYYFAKITQVDGDIIWTSPVWVQRNAVVLPVVLTKFTGTQVNENIRINWSTTREINAAYFEIEHSMNGSHFEKAGTVANMNGNSNNERKYDFLHTDPKKGINFYRLKQFDIDGNFKYSNIIPVVFQSSAINSIRINPNPVNTMLKVFIDASENAAITCKIYNVDGREVKTFHAAISSGSNAVSADISTLANGSYILVISSNHERIAETRFVKQ
jgi:trimeric autotransporter adhesin